MGWYGRRSVGRRGLPVPPRIRVRCLPPLHDEEDSQSAAPWTEGRSTDDANPIERHAGFRAHAGDQDRVTTDYESVHIRRGHVLRTRSQVTSSGETQTTPTAGAKRTVSIAK